jgi:hypothetical protein
MPQYRAKALGQRENRYFCVLDWGEYVVNGQVRYETDLTLKKWTGKLSYHEVHQIEGQAVKVFSWAKTVANCFKYCNKIGLKVALEALRETWRDKRCTMDQLWDYAKICRVEKVMHPHLESLVWVIGMSQKQPRNITASVRQRLRNFAQVQQEDFQAVLTCYALERLLYRLRQSLYWDRLYWDRFILKGALLFTLWSNQPHRATLDLDLLCQGDHAIGNYSK